jgi:hypothetical protein
VPPLPNCPPARGPRDNRDLEEVVGPSEETFEPRDADGPRPITFDDAETNQAALDSITSLRGEKAIDQGGVFASITRMFRPTGNMLQDLQRETGIPFWTWYRAVEIGRREAETFLAEPSYSIIPKIFQGTKVQDREVVQELFEMAGNPQGKAQLLKSLPPEKAAHVQAMHDQLWNLYTDYFGKLGYSADDVADLLGNYVPTIRKSGGDYAKFQHVRTPGKITKLVDRMVRTGEVPLDRETDAAVIAKTLFRAVSTETHLAPQWNLAVSQFKAFADQMQPQTAELFLRYLHQVRHAPDVQQMAMAESMRRIISKLDGQKGFKKIKAVLNTNDLRDLTSMLVSWNYQANLAWNPGAVLRQFQQPLQTVMPDMGVNNTLAAMKRAIGWFKDEKLQKYYEARGVITRNVMHEQFREVSEALSQFKPEGLTGGLKEAIQFFQEKGTVAFKKADDYNRIVAYDAMIGHSTPHLKQFAEGKTTWVQFFERSKLDRLDEAEGPFTQVVRGLLAEGNVEQAAHEMAFKFMNDTQFIYSRGNNPYVMNSTLGRFLGQYGTWPMQYTEYMRNMIKRGSQKNRIQAFSRWVGVNGALVAGASSVFGVDVSKWSFFSPMGYTGGPFMEMGQQAGSALSLATSGDIDVGKSWEKTKENWSPTIMGTEDADLIDRLQAQRLGKNLYQQVVPVPWGQYRRTMEALEQMWNADVPEATKRFLGMPSTTPPPK